MKAESLGGAYKPWLIACVTMLVGSLLLLAVAVTAAFIAFSSQTTPLWVIVVGGLALLGVATGFAGLFLLLAAAGWQSFREGRKVQILPPDR